MKRKGEGGPGLRFDGRTLLTGIFGDPVKHSLSPAMHNAAYAALGIERTYVPFHVTPDQLKPAIRAIPALGILGVNLTLPHKERGLRLTAAASTEARRLGAINCIVNRGGRLVGDNTDARGLEQDLREIGVAPNGRATIVIGAGGAAASAVAAAIRLGARPVVVVNRTIERARNLARRFRGKKVETYSLDALVDRELMGAAALIVNATSISLKEGRFPALDYGSTPPDCFFYDLVYAPHLSAFLDRAVHAGRSIADGAGMLLHQGILAFQLFNRIPAPADTMRRTLCERLARTKLHSPNH